MSKNQEHFRDILFFIIKKGKRCTSQRRNLLCLWRECSN